MPQNPGSVGVNVGGQGQGGGQPFDPRGSDSNRDARMGGGIGGQIGGYNGGVGGQISNYPGSGSGGAVAPVLNAAPQSGGGFSGGGPQGFMGSPQTKSTFGNAPSGMGGPISPADRANTANWTRHWGVDQRVNR